MSVGAAEIAVLPELDGVFTIKAVQGTAWKGFPGGKDVFALLQLALV